MVLEDLVEPDRDVYGRGSRGLVLDGEIAEQRPRRHRHVPDAPFDEIARRGGLGKHHQVRRRIELRDLRQHAADLLQIGAVVPLGGAELRDREARHGLKIGRQRAAWGGKGGTCDASLSPVAAHCRLVCLSQAMEFAFNRPASLMG